MELTVIITLSSLLLIAYIFDLSAKKNKDSFGNNAFDSWIWRWTNPQSD